MLVKICAPVAQMDQSGRFLNGKSRFDSVREHHSTSLIKFRKCRPRFDARTTGFFAVENKVRAKHFLSENPLLLKKTLNSDFTRVSSG